MFNPFLLSAGRCLGEGGGGRPVCQPVTSGVQTGADPLPPCSELTFLLPPELEAGKGWVCRQLQYPYYALTPPSQEDGKTEGRTPPGVCLFLFPGGFAWPLRLWEDPAASVPPSSTSHLESAEGS